MFLFGKVKCKLLSEKNQNENLQFAKLKKEVSEWSKEGITIARLNHIVRFTRRDGES